MKLLKSLFLLLSIATTNAIAQSSAYKFRVRYIDYTPLSNSRFIISGQSLDTDPQGIISLKLPEKISYVNIESASLKSYQIKFPQEGKAVLPKDPAVFVDIFIEKPKPDPLFSMTETIRQSQKALQKNVIGKLEEENKRGYNRIVALLKEKNLDNKELIKGRLEYYPLISSALSNYLNECRNFNDAFVSLSKSLKSEAAYEQFTNTIYNYNEYFNLLNANKDNYEQAIATYWKSKELSLRFGNLIDFALEEFHKPYILEVNYKFIPRLYEANEEKNKQKKKTRLKELSNDIQQQSEVISRRISGLGERITAINSLLKQ